MRTNELYWSGLIGTILGGGLGQCRRKLKRHSFHCRSLEQYFGELCSYCTGSGEVRSYCPKNYSYYAGLWYYSPDCRGIWDVPVHSLQASI